MSGSNQNDANGLQVGSGFLFHPVLSTPVFTPEKFTDDHIQFRKTARDFVAGEVEPWVDDIEHKKPGIMVKLMEKAAELGLFMVEIPEAYEGLGADKVTGMIIAEALSHVGSFAVTHGAHTGIGTLPIVFYGTEEQKKHYLPKLASGELMGAYALTEPGSGSDALAAKTTAKLTDDGKQYVLNGTKQFITNGAWAGLFTVFAQVDGEKFTAFLVERKTDGITIGPEEHKLGIRGSSTTQVILDDVHIPKHSVLGDIGRGHKIAFNILNIGRWKLGIGSIGAAKCALGHGVRFAQDRKQFKKSISSFGLIRQKIASSATLIYAGETMAYRLGGMLDARIESIDPGADDVDKQVEKVIEEFTIEASIVKVFGSETLNFVADEMLQLHGGYGYIEDYPLERIWRDARINRIFEGTNEINRLIIPATLLKRALKGQVPLMQFTQDVIAQLADPDTLPQKGEGSLGYEIWGTELAKRAVVFSASYAAQKYMVDLQEKQRILGSLADCLIDLYGMDSVVARASQAIEQSGDQNAGIHVQLTKLYCFEGRANTFQRLRRIAMMMAEGDELNTLYDNLGKLDQRYRVDYMGLQDAVAERMLDEDGYELA